LNNFNITRLLAAYFVLLAHSYALLGVLPPSWTGVIPVGLGELGVLMFFAISGYLVTASWSSDSNLIRFLQRRSLRIFPALIMCVAFMVLIIGPVFTRLEISEYLTHAQTGSFLLNSVLFIQYSLPGVFENNPHKYAVNGSLWSLPIEFMCYLLLAACSFLVRSRVVYPVLATLLAVAYTYVSSNKLGPLLFYASDLQQLLKYGTVFFLAATLFTYDLKMLLKPWIASLLLVFWFFYSSPLLNLVIVPLIVLGYGIASSPKFLKVFSKLDYSYGIYIYAFPVQQALIATWPEIGIANYIIATTVITVVLAALSWYLIEKPSLALKPKSRKATATKSML